MGDGPVALLARGVPDLGFDAGGLEVDCLGGEFNSDGGFGFVGELVFLEAGQQVGLAHARVCIRPGVPPITTSLNR